MSAMLKLQCAEDGLQYVHLTSPRVLLFHGCHINENSWENILRYKGWNLRKQQLVLLLDSLFSGGRCRQDASLKSSSVSRCVFRGEPTDWSSATLFSLRKACSVFFMQTEQEVVFIPAV